MAQSYQSVFLPSLGVINGTSLVLSGDATIGGKAKAAKYRATSNGSTGDVAYGWEIGAADDHRNGDYRDSADYIRKASAGAFTWGVTSGAVFWQGPSTFNSSVAVAGGDLSMSAGRSINADPSTSTVDCPIQYVGDPNTGYRYGSAADRHGIVCGGTTVINCEAGQVSLSVPMFSTSYIGLQEMAAPAGIANYAIIYAVDDGGGKTDLAAVFGSGAAQVFAQEP